MKIKELQKTVNIAWSPQPQHPIYLAAGTAAQQFDSSVNSSLEIYSTNFSDPSYDLELKSSLPSQYRFQKIIWSPTGFEAAHRNGLLVGGCEGGHVMIYSAAKMLAQEEGLIARQDKHTGAVTGLDFNPFQTNLLASCASESEIFIWDLNNTSTHMNPGAKTQPLEDVQNVAWNRQVQHILASVFSSRCVIWDLRKSEQIIKLSDTQSRVRWHAIQWHPEVATQVWLASEDDQAPVVQMWDLRYATAPAKTMQIHQRGVLGMSWCPTDADLMVSCGKDNRIYCWNPNSEAAEGEILSEVATTASWYSNVQWCPRNPALIASSSLDGNVSVYSLFGGTQQQVQTANKIADSFPGMDQFAQAPTPQQSTQIVYHDLKRAPKWIKRPCGVSFGFGGKLVHFNLKSKNVNISQVTTEPELVERANALERSLSDANYSEYCRQRADQQTDQNGRYLWYFIKANFEMNPKEELLNLLGYNSEDVNSKFSKFVKLEDDNQGNLDQLTNNMARLNHQPIDNNTVFDNIAVNQQRELITEEDTKLTTQFKIPSGDHADSLVTEALLTGNLEAAVELCFESKRISEALIIASTAGIEFLTKIQNRYLKEQQKSELSNIISALVTRDWMDFVSRCTVDSWKEALVAALKHSERKVVDICEHLGDRLLEECSESIEYTRNAMLCYVCAGSIDKLVAAWYQLKQLEQKNTNYKLNTVELQELAEIVMLMAKSLEQQGFALEMNGEGRFAEFISEYGGLLASQGALTAALAYIFALGNCEQPELAALRERLYNTVNHKPVVRAPQNMYNRTQQPVTRSSFSNPQAAVPGYNLLNNSISNQPVSNNWNNTTAPISTYPSSAQQPTLFNPLTAKPAAVDPPAVHHPPRPLSTSSSHGANSAATTGIHSRSKYVLDPSVAAPGPSMGYGNTYNPVQSAVPTMPASAASFNTSPFNNPNSTTQPQQPLDTNSTYMQPTTFNPMATSYMPGIAPLQTATQPPQQHTNFQNMPRNPTPPPGWNDPPALKSTRAPKKVEAPNAVAAPITHPLFGVDPNQNPNNYMDPNAQYQNAGMPRMPPHPQSAMLNPGIPMGGVMNPGMPTQNNNPQFPTQMNFQTSAIANPQQQQQQSWNNQANMGYTEQPAQIQRQVQPPKEKAPLPEEYIYMQTVLEELKTQCLNAAADPRTKRKFVDVAKRLENLYDCLRDDRLIPATIATLNQIIQFIQIGDYGNALQTHTQIAFGSDFSQCSGFMPGLKVLIQSASDLQVYLR